MLDLFFDGGTLEVDTSKVTWEWLSFLAIPKAKRNPKKEVPLFFPHLWGIFEYSAIFGFSLSEVPSWLLVLRRFSVFFCSGGAIVQNRMKATGFESPFASETWWVGEYNVRPIEGEKENWRAKKNIQDFWSGRCALLLVRTYHILSHLLSNLTTFYHTLSHLINSHPVQSHFITPSHHIFSNLIISHRILSHFITPSHRILSHLIISQRKIHKSYHISPHLIISHRILSHLITSCS